MRGYATLNLQRLTSRSKPSKVICFLANGGQKPVVKVTLRVPKKVSFGQSVAVVGSNEALGSWNPNSSSISLEWHDGHEWVGVLDLPAGEEVEYKYVVRGKEGVLEWQPGSNQVLKLPAESAGEVRVVDSWCGGVHEVQVANELASATGAALVESLEEELVQPFSAAQPPSVEAAAPAVVGAPATVTPAEAPQSSSSSGTTPSVAAAEQRADPEQEEQQQLATAGGPGALAVGAVAVSKPLEEMTVKQLKELAKELGVPVSGRKMDLVDRIRDAMGSTK